MLYAKNAIIDANMSVNNPMNTLALQTSLLRTLLSVFWSCIFSTSIGKVVIRNFLVRYELKNPSVSMYQACLAESTKGLFKKTKSTSVNPLIYVAISGASSSFKMIIHEMAI